MKTHSSNLIQKFNELHRQEVKVWHATSNGDMLAICSGKGGVEKSEFACQLALSWQRQGKKVLLFDADFSFPSLHILLKETPAYSLVDVMEGRKDLKDIVFSTKRGVDLISSVKGSLKLAEMTQGELWSILMGLKTMQGYDKIIFDLGNHLSEQLQYFCDIVQKVILVVTADKLSLIHGYHLIKLIHENSDRARNRGVGVCISMSSDKEVERVYATLNKTCEQYLSLSLEHVVIEKELS